MPLSSLDIPTMDEPTLRNTYTIDKLRIPPQEMKPWRDIQPTVCSFCSKLQREKLLCAKVRRVVRYLLLRR